ncbi:hypothetical protein B0H10DRAFT_2427413 [Mycena sp. CBHHK59/15]|nr:hypothetical protein B0H10DRAFT_2427413 [Mycena sp. CBHHK59/15]
MLMTGGFPTVLVCSTLDSWHPHSTLISSCTPFHAPTPLHLSHALPPSKTGDWPTAFGSLVLSRQHSELRARVNIRFWNAQISGPTLFAIVRAQPASPMTRPTLRCICIYKHANVPGAPFAALVSLPYVEVELGAFPARSSSCYRPQYAQSLVRSPLFLPCLRIDTRRAGTPSRACDNAGQEWGARGYTTCLLGPCSLEILRGAGLTFRSTHSHHLDMQEALLTKTQRRVGKI